VFWSVVIKDATFQWRFVAKWRFVARDSWPDGSDLSLEWYCAGPVSYPTFRRLQLMMRDMMMRDDDAGQTK
jgi:hypothetical protein